jgi:prolyl-tRNA editing enzyme YbaK/EbsC (Cys-tRNA(Pro) deacylase)
MAEAGGTVDRGAIRPDDGIPHPVSATHNAAVGWKRRNMLASTRQTNEPRAPRGETGDQFAMSLDSVREFLADEASDIAIIELSSSTATVALAVQGHGVTPAQIAKTLSLRVREQDILVVTSGDARLDNKKFKAAFGGKARMLGAEEVLAVTGHPIGGVCPFGLATPLPVYCDVSLRAFDEVVPAAGSAHSALRINPLRMAELAGAQWVDVCQPVRSIPVA